MLKIALLLIATQIASIKAFENTCNNNIADYWGQNSFGAANAQDPSQWQKRLSFYCDDATIDIIPVSFLTTFFSTGGFPSINLANSCNDIDNTTFPGTSLINCPSLADDIKYCQQRGKAITLSLGGATGGAGFTTESEATAFADTIWNLFLGGSSDVRPFGDAILDGIDLDIEGGGPNYYTAFLNKLLVNFGTASKKYYLTAAPQCVYPDANLQVTLNSIPFDAIYVQFYNNPCGLQTFGKASQWNFGTWDYWARNISPNPNVKVYIGAPASQTAAGGGYIPIDTLQQIALQTRQSFPSFGGVMFWDASQAYANGRIDQSIKNAMSTGASCSGDFVYPACSAANWVTGSGYGAGSIVSHNGYIWESKWYSGNEPSGDSMGDWSPISACQGAGTTNPPQSTPNTPTKSIPNSGSTYTLPTYAAPTLAVPTITTSQSNNTSTTQDCNGISPWAYDAIYVGGDTIVYQSNVWKASWWTLNELPGSPSGVWVQLGACTTKQPDSDVKIPALSSDSVSSVSRVAAKYPLSIIKPAKKCSDAEAWQEFAVYEPGSRVSFRGQVFVASWRTVGETPSESSSEVWNDDVICTFERTKALAITQRKRGCQKEWSIDATYYPRSLISLKGELYQAKKLSNGKKPSADSSFWTLTGSCSLYLTQ
ncbi:glycoside hydrolase superfamily [Spinellus fusiger]|nr:glycoside hydrolase superfamily [Spinellus fusiger]